MSQITLKEIELLLDKKLENLVTKADAATTEKRIVTRIDEAQEELAAMTAAGFEDIQTRLDVRAKIQAFERKFQKLEQTLHISL